MSNDRRIWQPDETCQPFLLENSTVNVNFPVFRFRVPDGNIGVIANILIGSTQFAPIVKSGNRIIIKKQNLGLSGFPSDDRDTISLNGALLSVEENTPNAGLLDNIPGFMIAGGGAFQRPCRIILDEGCQYEIINSGVGVNLLEISIFGWVFPRLPQG